VSRRVVGRDLAGHICKGDREALGVLFRRHIRLVHGIGRRILRDSAEAEDLAQDVFCTSSGSAISTTVRRAQRAFLDRPDDVFSGLKQEGLPDGAPLLRCGESGRSDAEKLAAPIIAEYDHSQGSSFRARPMAGGFARC